MEGRTMGAISYDINTIERGLQVAPDFPQAPPGWSADEAERIAMSEGLKLSDEHWRAVRALQEFFARHEDVSYINMRELHDALDELFHSQGGIRYLYMLFPGGPIAQGCRIAGLKAPFLATDKSFGSVA
jgi:tRNA 2-thiouridine synthesizing protein E